MRNKSILIIITTILLGGCDLKITQELLKVVQKKDKKDTVSQPVSKYKRGVVETTDEANKNLEYFYYVPEGKSGPFPVLLCIPGLNGSGESYVAGVWQEFADKNGFVVISPTFKFSMNDWKISRSYQFVDVWSGNAIIAILDKIGKEVKILKNQLYLFGCSAGAQVAHRFAIWKSDMCVAVAAHAAGGYTYPGRKIPAKFFITIGEKDTERKEKTYLFVENCKMSGNYVEFKEYPNLGHAFIDDQVVKSLEFFEKAKKELKK